MATKNRKKSARKAGSQRKKSATKKTAKKASNKATARMSARKKTASRPSTKATAAKSPVRKKRGAKPQAPARAKTTAKKKSKKPRSVSATGLPAAPAPPPPPPDPVGSFAWHELMTTSAERCGDFYQGLFNWSRSEKEVIPGLTYTVFRNKGKDTAGMMTMAGPDWEGQPPRWIPYVNVRSVEAAVTKAEQLGGRVIVPPSDIAEGRFAVVSDPVGATIGVFHPDAD